MLNDFIKINLKLTVSIFLFFLINLNCNLHSQTVSVGGRITANRFAVQNAKITFIYNADTTTQFSAITDDKGYYQIDVVTAVKNNNKNIPQKFSLGQSYPNPFASKTSIPYGINDESDVELIIYDILGREVRKVDVGRQSIGAHSIIWDGRNNLGNKVVNGIYFYRLNVDNDSQVRKMIYNSGITSSLKLPSTSSFNFNDKTYKSSKSEDIVAGNYSIKITNTKSTLPYIITQELNDVQIQNDTTINVSISNTLPVAEFNFDSTRQIIRGFGASNILLWRPDMTNSEIETAFGTGDGKLGFTILRIMVEADSTRWGLNITTAKKAYEMGATIIASPWHAPSELSEDIGAINRVRYDKYAEYAEHLNNFVAFMESNGVPIYGVSIQNEPDIEENWTSWTSSEIFTFMKDYAHLIEGTNVMAPESFHFDRDYSDPILNDPTAEANTDIVCGHIYGGGRSYDPLAEEKGKEVWMTEYLINGTDGGVNMDTSMIAVIATAESINDCMNANMSAYVWWYLVRYYGPLNDETGYDPRLPQGAITKKGYIMSQFSRFVRPGYFRVESGIYPSTYQMNVSAFIDPEIGKKVIIVINPYETDEEIVLRIAGEEGSAIFSSYSTSLHKNVEYDADVQFIEGNYKYAIPKLSMTTFILN